MVSATIKRDYAMSNKRSKLKKLLILIIIFSFIIYFLLDFNIKTNLVNLKEHLVEFTSSSLSSSSSALSSLWDIDKSSTYTTADSINHAYFVDTDGCKMPSFNVIDDRIAQYMFRPQRLYCGVPLTAITYRNQLILNMNKNELEEIYNITEIDKISCYYQEFKRKTDTTNQYSNEKHFLNLKIKTKIQFEYIRVICSYENLGEFYTDFHTFPNSRSENDILLSAEQNNDNNNNYRNFHHIKKTVSDSNINGKSDKSDSDDDVDDDDGKRFQYQTINDIRKLSVLIIGIDSVSRLNFLRQMNETATLLRHNFNAFEFYGYNKVGDNTYPNLIPVLSGLDETELNQACFSLKNNISYDDCPFIWQRYKDIGYTTIFSEDSASISLFNYFRKGFKKQPTDFYTRPLFIEMEKTIAHKLKSNFHLCLGGRRPLDVIFNYFKRLVNIFKKSGENFFSLLWTSSSTHDYFNTPLLIDKDVTELILTLNSSHILNRTALILMSDHGLRWGPFRKTYQGMMEERQPFLFIVLPKWFSNEYPLAVANLKDNKHKLTTHFDLYATLMDLSDTTVSITNTNLEQRLFEMKEEDSLPRSISLFLPIPSSRTCEMAGIASHWCTCHEKRTLPTNHQRVQRAARFIVKQINKKLEMHPQCRTLYLNSIIEANISSANKIIQKEARDYDFLIDVTVRLQTKPGLGEFEATVRLSDSNANLTGTISRTNLYGKQSYCIDDYTLKMYCYCAR